MHSRHQEEQPECQQQSRCSSGSLRVSGQVGRSDDRSGNRKDGRHSNDETDQVAQGIQDRSLGEQQEDGCHDVDGRNCHDDGEGQDFADHGSHRWFISHIVFFKLAVGGQSGWGAVPLLATSGQLLECQRVP